MVIVLRPAVAGDAGFLADMLVEAVNWRSGRHFGRERVLSEPGSAHYVLGWPGPGDVGTVAEAAGVPVGAAWLRLFPADDPGYGFVAADVPELSMAVAADRRRQGVGRRLLRDVVSQARAVGRAGVSLAVERDNPAQDLYRSEGFRMVRSEGDSEVMLLTFATDLAGPGLTGTATGPLSADPPVVQDSHGGVRAAMDGRHEAADGG